MTHTAINPWTGGAHKVGTSCAMQAIESSATADECESVNLSGAFDSDAEWVEAFISLHGAERFGALVAA